MLDQRKESELKLPRMSIVAAMIGASLVTGLAAAGSSEAATSSAVSSSGGMSPQIDQVGCYPYNNWLIFYDSTGDVCFANPGKRASQVGWLGFTGWCSGNNAGSFTYEKSGGFDVVRTFDKWQCGPLTTSDRVWEVVIR